MNFNFEVSRVDFINIINKIPYFSSEQSIHRAKSLTSQDLTDGPDTYTDEKKIDAFISYRRINGAQLAR